MGYVELIELLQARLGFRNDTQDRLTYLTSELALAQYELETDPTINAWFLWRAADVCLDASCLSVAVPNGFVRLDDQNKPLFQAKDSPVAYGLTRAFADGVYAQDQSQGCPKFFTIQANSIRLDCRASGKLRLFYYSTNAKLSSAVQANLWTEYAFDLLLNKTGRAIAASIQNQKALEAFEKGYLESLRKFKAACIQMEDVGLEMVRDKSIKSAFDGVLIGQFFDGATGSLCNCGG